MDVKGEARSQRNVSLEAALQNGIDYLRAGDLPRAEDCFRSVLAGNSQSLPALNLLAVVLMQQKRFADAEPYLARAAKRMESTSGSKSTLTTSYG